MQSTRRPSRQGAATRDTAVFNLRQWKAVSRPLTWWVAAALAMPSAGAHAESLRCTGGTASEGDSRVSVLYKCGQPTMADVHCAPVFYPGTLNVVPEPLASAWVPCQPVEEWIYDRGAGHLIAVVRLRAGRVASIAYGHVPP